MSETALAEKIKKIMLEIREETNNPDQSMNKFCKALARAIVEETRKITITATAPNGPVSIINIE